MSARTAARFAVDHGHERVGRLDPARPKGREAALAPGDRAPAEGQSAELHQVLSGLAADRATALPHRAEMEARFGQSFAGVQAFMGPGAQETLQRLGAEALATGRSVAFRTATPSPALVAHELAHVVQQSRASGLRDGVGAEHEAHEHSADAAAWQAALGLGVSPALLAGGGAPAAVQLKKQPLPDDFEKMWEAHPHNYQEDSSENTSSADVNTDQGWDPDQWANTCAVRLSVMFNKLGGSYTINPQKAAAAGIKRGRLAYSKKTGFWYILSAKEMWTYVSTWYGSPHKVFPAKGRYKTEEEFQTAWSSEIQEYVQGKQGIVAFDKIFGYSGTGHVDIFQGESLSDAPEFYPCQSLKLWFVA